MTTPIVREFHWDRKIGGKMRQGETCTILPTRSPLTRMVQVRFEDGHTTLVERMALREPKKHGRNTDVCSNPGSR